MPLVDSGYTTRPISVPPHLPLILKQFCKAAIRTQPYDLLKWSSAYFRALAEGFEPPAKLRLEYPIPGSITGLTLGFLKVLLRQFGDYNRLVPVEIILQRWNDLSLDRRDLNLIMIVGRFCRKCQIKKFLAIAVGILGASLFDTMLMICELFTVEPDGGSGMIPVTLFMELYGYLAGLRCDGGKRESPEDPGEFVLEDSESQRAISIADQDTDADTELEHDNPNSGESSEDPKSPENSSVLPTKPEGSADSSDKILDLRPEKNRASEFSSHHPNIPGIGPRLTPEHVATVAVWMTECARLQEGMVGPRNLRHFQCPSLDHPGKK